MAHPIMFDQADPLLGRLRALALAFPDAAEKISHGHPAFFTTKIFAYYGGSGAGPRAVAVARAGDTVLTRHCSDPVLF